MSDRPGRAPSRAVVIANPNAGSAASLGETAGLTVWRTERPGHALELARRAVAEGYDTVVAAGGDGTVTEVVDALVPTEGRVRLGVLPLGTGNDLARSLAIPLDPAEALATLAAGAERTIDVIRVEPDDGPASYVVNVAAGGFSGQVDEVMDAEAKERWGPLAYVWSAAKVLPELTSWATTLTLDGEVLRVDALNIVVANGRTVAGGRSVAPDADLEDGLADVIIVRAASALDLTVIAARLAVGNYLESPAVERHRVRRARIESEPGMLFNVDGELLTRAACTFTVLPGALRVVVGEGYARPGGATVTAD